jgi:uncharacterized UPF0160 family protein
MDTLIATHAGRYHADDLVAIALLKIIYPTASVARLKKNESDALADYVVDRGKVFNPTIGRFDHHQGNLPMTRSNGVKYASTGLVWEYMYEKIVYAALANSTHRFPADIATNWETISTQLLHAMQYIKIRFDEALCQPIDSWDDGAYPDEVSTHLSSLVWDMAVSGCTFDTALSTVSTLVEARLLSTIVGNLRFGLFLKGAGCDLMDNGLLVSRLVYVKGLQWARNKLRGRDIRATVSPSQDTAKQWVLFLEPEQGVPTRSTFGSLDRAVTYYENHSSNLYNHPPERQTMERSPASFPTEATEGDPGAADPDEDDS